MEEPIRAVIKQSKSRGISVRCLFKFSVRERAFLVDVDEKAELDEWAFQRYCVRW